MNGENGLSDEDTSLGEPIGELKLLREEPDPGLLGRIHSSINRRSLAADGLDFTLANLFGTCFEYLKIIIQSLTDNEGRREER